MTSETSCAIAIFLYVMGDAVCNGQCSTMPKVGFGSLLYTLAMVLYLAEKQLIPRRYMRLAPRIMWFVDLLLTLLIHYSMNVVWCSLERCIRWMARIFCQNCPWCEYGVETLASFLLGFTTLYVVLTLVCPPKVKAKVEQTVGRALDQLHIDQGSGSFVERIKDFRTYVRGAIFFFRLTRDQRMLSIRVFEEQVERRQRGYVEPKQVQQDTEQDIAAERESQEEPEVEMQPLESQQQEEAAGIEESSV